MLIDSKNTRTKALEELYLGLQLMSVFFIVIVIKYFGSDNLSIPKNISTCFIIIYGLYVLVQFIIFIRNVYFKGV